MTKSHKTPFGSYSQLAINLYRLRAIAMLIEDAIPLPEDDQQFLITALRSIGEGNNADEALGVKRKRGEKRNVNSLDPVERRQMALSWIVAAMQSESEGGLGLSFFDAVERAAKRRKGEVNFGFTEETLIHYWDNHAKQRTLSFDPPLSSQPIRREQKPSKKRDTNRD
jgi:hypothetical protein